MYSMKPSLCSSFSPLSALIYAQSSRWSGPKGPLVLAQQGVRVVLDTNVNYLCAGEDEEYLSAYLRSGDRFADAVPPAETILFDYDLPMIGGEPDCGFDEYLGLYVCGNFTIVEDEPIVSLPPRCAWDDGYTRPPAPEYNATMDVCSNVVLDVMYNFTWQGPELLFLNATLILADVPMNQSGVESRQFGDSESEESSVLRQAIEVQFTHLVSLQDDSEHNDTQENSTVTRQERNEQYSRSGNPGRNTPLEGQLNKMLKK